MRIPHIGRRAFLASSAGLAGTAAFGGFRPAFAQSYPSRNIEVVIPTGEGGGADRDARTFTTIWQRHLKTNFEFGYYPGAGGQVGYKFYMNRKPEAYSLIFSNLGPEVIMLELQNTGIAVGKDLIFFQQVLSEPMAIFVGARSPIKSIQQLVDEGKKRTVTVSVSRLPHPASIGTLALAEATGAKFNLVPFGGGNPSAMAAITGEVDCCALPITQPITMADQVRTLVVFDNKNPAPAETNDAPPVNAVFGTKIGPMTSSRAWGIHKKAADAHPDRLERLKETAKQTLADPDYVKAVEGTGVPKNFIDTGGQDEAMATAAETRELAHKYRDLLKGA